MQMNIFGGFSLSDGLVSVNESTLHSNKLNRLLIYIFCTETGICRTRS